MVYTEPVGKKKGSKPVNLNFRIELMERVERYRFRQMFETKTEAMEFLLEFALKANPKKLTKP